MGMWEQGITLPAKEVKNVNGMLSGTCPGLVEGNEYVFRIKAVNKDSKGRKCPSLPSPQSESMIAKIRFSMFYVARTTLQVILFNIIIRIVLTERLSMFFYLLSQTLLASARNV